MCTIRFSHFLSEIYLFENDNFSVTYFLPQKHFFKRFSRNYIFLEMIPTISHLVLNLLEKFPESAL